MNVHFIGIEGVSMKTLAEIVKADGHVVTGSDVNLYGHNANNVKNADLVVYSSAIKYDNVELIYAKRHNIKTVTRAQFLHDISTHYSSVVAVAGCHGKTTTSTMLASIFEPDCPTLHIGAKIPYSTIGKKNIFITEACEYQRNFLTLRPHVGVITNVDFDHPDSYKSLDDTINAFSSFCSNCKTCLINADDKNSLSLTCKENVITYGTCSNADFIAKNYVKTDTGCVYNLFYKDLFLTKITLNEHGEHNFYNSLSASAGAFCLGVGARQVQDGLLNFKNANRRNEKIGKVKNCDVFSDYAHHPKEIKSEISLLKEKYSKVAVVFQPHTFSRTKALFKDFISAFSLADKVYFIPTYASREKGIDDGILAKHVPYSIFVDGELSLLLMREIQDFDALCFMGAGDIDNIARLFCTDVG